MVRKKMFLLTGFMNSKIGKGLEVYSIHNRNNDKQRAGKLLCTKFRLDFSLWKKGSFDPVFKNVSKKMFCKP